MIATSECHPVGTSPPFCVPSLTDELILDLFGNQQRSADKSSLIQVGASSHEESANITAPKEQDLPFTSHITPNPVRNSFHLVVQSPKLYETEFSLLSNDGKQFITGELKVQARESEFYFDLSLLPTGTYFLRMSDEEGTIVTHKIVKL